MPTTEVTAAIFSQPDCVETSFDEFVAALDDGTVPETLRCDLDVLRFSQFSSEPEAAQAALKAASVALAVNDVAAQLEKLKADAEAATRDYLTKVSQLADKHAAPGCTLNMKQEWNCPKK